VPRPAPSAKRVFIIAFLALSLLRLPSFFRSVLDWDESLYVLIAQQWLAGHLPYTSIWDNKPPGIYAIFAIFIDVFHNPILAIRLATVTFAAITATALHRLTLIVLPGDPRRLATLAAAAFIIASLSNDGLSANTELFMETFSVLAVLAAIAPNFRPNATIARGLCTGLLFGLACMTKYVAVFEAPAILFALIAWPGAGQSIRKLVGAAAGLALPPALTLLTYAAAGHLALWWQCAIAANLARVAIPVSQAALRYAAIAILPPWLPLVAALLFIVATAPATIARIIRGRAFPTDARLHILLVLWVAGAAAGIASAKLFFDHYFLQILPVACLCLAWVSARLCPRLANWSRPRAALLFGALLVIPAVAGAAELRVIAAPLITRTANGLNMQQDGPAAAAAALRPAIAAGASLYVFDGQPIVYALTNAKLPTRYILPSILTGCFLSRVAGIDPLAELTRILSQNPDFILVSTHPTASRPNPAVYAALTADLAARYSLWREAPDSRIYRLILAARPYRLASPTTACP
jgi:4-amino-4-deoxy-L-arabinose transferase-like glycosyltransferase